MHPTDPNSPPELYFDTPLMQRIRYRAGHSHLKAGNRITLLKDSAENFPAWLEAIAVAEESIVIEMYIFADDPFGRRLRDALIDKAQQGVAVYLVYDWLGSLFPALKGFFRPLKAAGAKVLAYNPIGLTSGLGLLSRNHRKSFVIDGKVAFVSGLCASSRWAGNPQKGIAAWRDTGLKLEGPAVQDVIDAFCQTLSNQEQTLPNFLQTTSPIAEAGTVRATAIATTPQDNNMMRLDLNAISLAHHTLWLTDAYFMPTRLYLQALINAAEDGVDVRILVPRTSDIKWIGSVSRTRYRELLEAGIRVFEWNGPMIHAKSAIADGYWARVGSTNLNFSSWHLNRELDVVIEDSAIVGQLQAQFLHDLEHATEIILNQEEAQAAKHKRLARKNPAHGRQKAQAAAQHLLHLTRALDGHFYGTRIIDESEAWAYMSLGVVMLIAMVVIWLMPHLIIVPIMLILFAGGISTMLHALTRLKMIRGHRKAPSHTPDKDA